MKTPEAPVLDRVAGSISRYNMLQSGHRVGVAVSGGADSVCLLHILHSLAPCLGISLTVLHLNHKLRGAESDADAAFCRDLAASLSLPFVEEEVRVADLNDNLEQAGRNARRAFFGRLIDSGKLDRVATGHTRSDQAETVLYRLLRGSGTAGIAGIAPVLDGVIVRPLLDCVRSGIEAYLREHSLPWREDYTNSDVRFARNRIRHELLPMLVRDYNPAIADVLAGMAAVARDEEEYWDRELESVTPGLIEPADGALKLRAGNEWAPLHPALKRRVVRRLISRIKGDLRGIGTAHIEQMVQLADQRNGNGGFQIPGLDVRRSFNWVRFAKTGEDLEVSFEIPVEPPGRISAPGGDTVFIDVIEFSGSESSNNSYNSLCLLDFDRLSGPLVLRNWRPGDWYAPKGSHDKIKHLFQRSRVPVWERKGWPVLTSGSRIVWAKRFGVAADVAPGVHTRRVLRVRARPVDSSEPNMCSKASDT
jgi:tRNA(Ile)-lysidine synthase